MYNEKTNELEQKLKKVFGEKATLAITNAKLGNRGYMVRIESQGIPYTVDSFKENNEEALNNLRARSQKICDKYPLYKNIQGVLSAGSSF